MTHDDGEPVPTGGDDYTPYGDAPPPSEALTALRLRAESLVRDENDAALLDLRESLHDDRQWYAHLWGPSLAVAASRVGRDDAIDLLRESVVAGFSQPEMFEGALEKCFATDPAWPQLVDDMAANVPEPRFVFFDWPGERPAAPLVLDRIGSERVAAFTDRLPERTSSAWETALTLLEWARTSWEHANDHVLEPDALGVLERVDAGARFACVEYSIVLSQALNAAGIPGRRVSLRQHNHHVGAGRGHVVSEAWIDDLDRWVVLDGQNGAYWVDERENPLGVPELQDALRERRSVRMVGLVDAIPDSDAATWVSYFDSISTTGCTWASPGFAPIFQDMGVIKTDLLLHERDDAYPALSAIALGTGGTLAEPHVTLSSRHPYATGFEIREAERVTTVEGTRSRWSLDLTPGRHDVAIAATTPYGHTAANRLSYSVGRGSD